MSCSACPVYCNVDARARGKLRAYRKEREKNRSADVRMGKLELWEHKSAKAKA
jgi:hypothetical protein